MIKYFVKIIPKGIYTIVNKLLSMLPNLDKIKKKRRKLGLTQFKLSKEADISQSSLTKIERGRMEPSYNVAKRIFETLDSIESQSKLEAKDKMCSPVISLSPDDRISKAKKIMKEKNFSQLPVMEKGIVVGSLTERDIAFKEHNDSAAVSTIMGDAFLTVREDTSLRAVKALLREDQAVLIKKKKKIVGIINLADYL